MSLFNSVQLKAELEKNKCLKLIEEAILKLEYQLDKENLSNLLNECASVVRDEKQSEAFAPSTGKQVATENQSLLNVNNGFAFEAREELFAQQRQESQNLTDIELMQMSTKMLNKFLLSHPKYKEDQIRYRKKCLRNRKYAQNSRRKYRETKETLRNKLTRLQNEVSQINIEILKTKRERDFFRAQFYNQQKILN